MNWTFTSARNLAPCSVGCGVFVSVCVCAWTLSASTRGHFKLLFVNYTGVGGENSVLEVPVLEAVELEASEEEPR